MSEEIISEDLHELAGLIFSEVNEDNEPQYLGTRLQWLRYEELLKEEKNND